MHHPSTRPALPMPSFMSALLLISLASSLLSLPFVVDATPSNKYNASLFGPDARALLRWKSTLVNGNRSVALRSWTTSADPCSWFGITCSGGGGSIAEIDLTRAGIVGNLDSLDFSSFPFLTLLRLRHNLLSGPLPSTIGSLSHLASLDLAGNRLSGILPPSLANLSQLSHLDLSANEFHGHIPSELGRLCNLTLLRIDNNGLTLEIPDEITSLHGLVFLNLSRNRLSGNIPELIGQLNWLESLDLSLNQLSGTIPPSISSLNFLSSLNLSNNKLSGRIPSGNQLQTLNDPSIYIGNYGLCGPPLTENCSEDGTQVTPDGNGNEPGDDGDEDDTIWSYLGMSLGISVGFWGVWSILIFKKSWRVAYFHYVDNMQDMLSQMFLRNSY